MKSSKLFVYLMLLQVVVLAMNASGAANSIVPGQRISATIESAGEFDVYTFSANLSDTMSILMAWDSGPFDVAFSLYAPDDTLVADVPGSYTAELPRRILNQSGLYRISCRDKLGTRTGAYSISLLKHPGTNVNEIVIAPGQTHSGSIASSEMHSIRFAGADGDIVSILMASTSGLFSVRFEVYAPDGTRVLNAPAALSTAEARSLHLTQTGDYQIVCRDSGGRLTGTYAISLVSHSSTNLNEVVIAPGQTLNGSITAGELDSLTFSASGGDAITVLLGWQSGTFNVRFEVYGPDGLLLTNVPGSLTAQLRALRLAQTGRYQIVCRDSVGKLSGLYGITLVKNPGPNQPDPDGGEIQSGQVKTGSVSMTDIDAFTFPGVAGGSVSLNMRWVSGELNTHLELHDPDGNVVRIVPGSYSSAITNLCLRQTGTYLVLCRDVEGYRGGTYSLSMRYSAPPPIPTSSAGPYLALSRCENNVAVQWLTNAVDFILESTDVLPATNWIPVTQPLQVLGGRYLVELSRTNRMRFYRLRCQSCPPN